MDFSEDFCYREKDLYNTKEFEECDYSEPREQQMVEEESKEAGLTAIYGTIISVDTIYSSNKDCIEYYNIEVNSESYGIVHFILSANTFFVDCFFGDEGVKVVGFFDPSLPMPLIYPPQYQIRVIALDLPGRFVKADFYDCFLVSQDNQLQLEVTNNTYILNEDNRIPYCGNISNKYMVALYSSMTKSIPAKTQPNVIIVLR
ncbi:MAG TPA: hypothetical protein DHW61_13920 [Lachnoclostridium phytofermentans]|uniref:Uncharacterized protein n=1 Tax=Lachnoclostridium phytofermentans TaxID=66219 RepID=A0A3D2XA53_9FIRM|nr:hypothetical protein [Lachnoclostridium sp.]HCL03483.1 hypothetical protein [Lachnoclostridium phytofermentans]